MKDTKCINSIMLATFFLASLGFESSAYAYLDPGTGSIILQSILAGIVCVAVVVRIYWHRLKAFFSPKKESEKNVVIDKKPGNNA